MSLTKRDPRLRAFVRLDSFGQVVGGSLVLRKRKPVTGKWIEIDANVCCPSGDNPFSFFSFNGGSGLLHITVDGNAVAAGTPGETGGFNAAVGSDVDIEVTGEGVAAAITVINSLGAVTTSDTGADTATASFNPAANLSYIVVASVSGTTTTTTTTTTTSTTSTTTTTTTTL